MEMNIYCCADGALLLVPDCCQPSLEARHLYGPLRFIGSVELDDNDVFGDRFVAIEQHAFAYVPDPHGIDELLAAPTFHTRSDPKRATGTH
jgi:hypothetical protein